MNIKRTEQYYKTLKEEDLCDCSYCRNYRKTVREALPEAAAYLSSIGVDIAKPFETMPLSPDDRGMIQYIGEQYIVFGNRNDFRETCINDIGFAVADSHPATDIDGEHFVIEMGPVYLKWVIDETEKPLRYSDACQDFVSIGEYIPDVLLEIRYYSSFNFVGERIDGYVEPLALLTEEAAAALAEVSAEAVSKGYRLKIFDAYRPKKAVDHFMAWAKDIHDIRMKEFFYPQLDKEVLIPEGYIAAHSSHSRGSTLDLTLFDMKEGRDADMGGPFDYFGELSHPSYRNITEKQYRNRMILREMMERHGFAGIETEWWHYTLVNEPYPDTYFTFDAKNR